jgi:predicted lipid-binding transport protein (Tim44 family)
MNRNRTGRTYSKCFSITLLASAFLISSDMPLLASPRQSSQSDTASQKPDDSLPDAPQPQAAQTPQNQEQPAPAPSGAAGAETANVKGAPVAQPAGAAVAPARQRGHRSLLLKVGLLAGAGIAVGSAVALSERSPARPPGASPAIQR